MQQLWGNPNNEATSTATATVRTNGLTLICPRNANKQKEPRDTKCRKSISQGNHFSKKIHGKSLISLKLNSRWLGVVSCQGLQFLFKIPVWKAHLVVREFWNRWRDLCHQFLKLKWLEKRKVQHGRCSHLLVCDKHWFDCSYHHFVYVTHWWCFKMCVWEIG